MVAVAVQLDVRAVQLVLDNNAAAAGGAQLGERVDQARGRCGQHRADPLPTCSRNAASASAPPASAARAATGSRPDSMSARRTCSTGTAAATATATASVSTPSRALWRSSPRSNRRRKCC